MRIALLLALFLLPLPALAETVELFGGKLQCSLPKGFTALSADEIAGKFPPVRPPQHAYGNARRSVTIAFTHSTSAVTDPQLAELRAFLEKTLGPSARKWLARDMLTLNGKPWFRLEFISQALDTTVHNEILGTSLEGRALLVNFNSSEEDYPGVKSQLEASRKSLQAR